MGIKLKEKDSLWTEFRDHLNSDIVDINCQFVPMSDLEGVFKWFCKDIQRNAIEVAVQRCSEEADADVYFHGWLAEESMKSDEPFEEGEDYEVYVINSSILDCKQKLFEENNLI